MRILIPGISGSIARLVARRLVNKGHEVIGIDVRPWVDAPEDIELHEVDIRKRGAEDIFRKRRPQVVVHMATVSALNTNDEQRHRINLGGTRSVFQHCRAYGVEHVIFVGRHTYYGAGADSPLYHTEDEPPQELATYPELADLVAADLFAATELWRTPELVTSVLRLVYTLGPSGAGTLGGFLRGPAVPTVLGFDPLFHFMHEEDAAAAIVETIEKRVRGIFNVCGPQPMPLSMIAHEAGRRAIPIPRFLLARVLGHGGLPKLPEGALSHIQFPIVVDGGAFRKATGFNHVFSELETIRAFAQAFPRR
jgi:UDP-glucose 4-epimerase